MSELPILSGKEIIKALVQLGYKVVRQRGSHIRLYCVGGNFKRPTLHNISCRNFGYIVNRVIHKIIV